MADPAKIALYGPSGRPVYLVELKESPAPGVSQWTPIYTPSFSIADAIQRASLARKVYGSSNVRIATYERVQP